MITYTLHKVSMGLTISGKTAKNLAVGRKNWKKYPLQS